MWHRRNGRLHQGLLHRPGGCGRRPGDDGDDGLPRPRRRGPLDHRARGARPPPARDHRRPRRAAADGARRPGDRRDAAGDRLLRRGLQLHRAARGAPGGGSPVPHRLRHRGHPARLAGVGRGRRHPAQRHVRVRALGRPLRRALPRPRPHGHQAALLLPDPRRRAVRLRAEGDPRPPARRGGRRPRRAARAALPRQDPGPRRLPRDARGPAGLAGPRPPRGPHGPALLAARGDRAHRRPRHHRRATSASCSTTSSPAS